MPAGSWGEDEGRGARLPRQDRGGLGAGPGAPAAEALAHELALVAALDRGRPDLSPTAEESARMRDRLFAALDAEWDVDQAGAEQDAPEEPCTPDAETTAVIPAVPPTVAVTKSTASGTRVLGGPDRAEPKADREPEAVGSTDAGAELTADPVVPRRGRARHALPKSHPDHPDNRPGGARGPRRPDRPSLRRRVALVGGFALLALVGLAGGGAMISRDALPGDTLYAMKLMSESTGTAFTFGDVALAQRHLTLAETRLAELRKLAADSSLDPAVVESALSAFDSSVSAGSRLLLAGAEPPSAANLNVLARWATAQSQRIATLEPNLPGETVTNAEESRELLARLTQRATQIRARSECTTVVSSAVDDLGPLPATGPCIPRPVSQAGQGAAGSRAGGTSSRPGAGSTTPSTTAEGTPTSEEGLPSTELLPGGVAPDTSDLVGSATGATSSTSGGTVGSSTTAGSGGLLPPITLPPLLPGFDGITIG